MARQTREDREPPKRVEDKITRALAMMLFVAASTTIVNVPGAGPFEPSSGGATLVEHTVLDEDGR